MCRIWRISLPFGCILAYQVWYVCFQGKARLFQHTDSQLETFWTLQVRVVVLDDGLYLATWYTMDGLNRKRYIRNPIWIESTYYHCQTLLCQIMHNAHIRLDWFQNYTVFSHVFVMSSNPVHGDVYSIQHYLVKFVSDLRQVGGFLRFPPPIKLTVAI